MKEHDVFVVADNVLSPLGRTTQENFNQLKQNKSSVKHHQNSSISSQPFCASLFDKDEIFIYDGDHKYTKFEQLLIVSIQDALRNSGVDAKSDKTILIISSTKG